MHWAPGIPHALILFRGGRVMHYSGAPRRENAIGCLKIGCDTFRCHHPRKRMIQYSTGTDDQSRRRSVAMSAVALTLGIPAFAGMTPSLPVLGSYSALLTSFIGGSAASMRLR